jgi:hypothetical protein
MPVIHGKINPGDISGENSGQVKMMLKEILIIAI